jgi:hypothetical protein
MAVLRRRSKMISFRISEEEYENFVGLCASHGVRSLSDLARDALHRLSAVPNHNGDNGSSAALDAVHLHSRIAKLEGEIERLTRIVEQPVIPELAHLGTGNGETR